MKRQNKNWCGVLAFAVCLLGVPAAFGVGTGGTGLIVLGALAPVTGVVVDGVAFDASQAAITVNGRAHASPQDLRPGMVAGIYARADAAGQYTIAKSIMVSRQAVGSIAYVGTGGTGLVVAGVSVVPRGDAVLEGISSVADLAAGDTIDVYGYSDGTSGVIHATRVERVAATGELELHGVASAVTGGTFSTQGVTVDYSAATLSGLSGALASGDRVVVRGGLQGNVIVASSVTAEPVVDGNGESEAEVEDSVSAIVAPGAFVVGDFEVDANHASFSGGTVADLAVGRVVQVAGAMHSGVLVASSVEFDDSETEQADVDGTISAVSSAASFTVGRTAVDASTATFVNGQATDIAPGRVVRVVGLRSGGVLKATRVTFVAGGVAVSGSKEIEATVTDVTSPGMFVASGVSVDARNARVTGGTLAKVRVGTRVHASGLMQGGVLVAKTLEIDD